MHDSITFVLFFAFLLVAKKKGTNRLTNDAGQLVVSPQLLLLHAAGIFLFGLLPLFFEHPVFPLFFRAATLPVVPAVVTALLLLVVLWLAPRLAAKAKLQASPSLQLPLAPYLVNYFLLRVLFIAAYEAWFRGFLLADSLAFLGLPLAVALNLFLYTLLHAVNGRQEMLGCLPFGLLLCGLCVWTGQVWPAIVLHLALTLSYELTLLKKYKTLQHENLPDRRFGLHRA